MRRKILIGAGIAALVLIAVLAVILICFPKGQSMESGDTDSRYAYTFTQRRDGLAVAIADGEAGCKWTPSLVDTALVAPKALKGESGQSLFLLQPSGSGTGRVEFSLTQDDVPIYRIYVDVQVDGSDVRVLDCGHLELLPEMTDEAHRYSITMTDRDTYLIRMNPALDAHWLAKSDNGNVELRPYDPWDGAYEAEINDGTAVKEENKSTHSLTMFTYFKMVCTGTAEDVVYVYDRSHGEALRITLEYDEATGLHPVDHGMVRYTEEAQ